jgi:hypothetical protein
VRNYITLQSNSGGITFKCAFCAHTVAILDFDQAKGNRRTQAAAIINQHVKEQHYAQLQVPAPTKA